MMLTDDLVKYRSASRVGGQF